MINTTEVYDINEARQDKNFQHSWHIQLGKHQILQHNLTEVRMKRKRPHENTSHF